MTFLWVRNDEGGGETLPPAASTGDSSVLFYSSFYSDENVQVSYTFPERAREYCFFHVQLACTVSCLRQVRPALTPHFLPKKHAACTELASLPVAIAPSQKALKWRLPKESTPHRVERAPFIPLFVRYSETDKNPMHENKIKKSLVVQDIYEYRLCKKL